MVDLILFNIAQEKLAVKTDDIRMILQAKNAEHIPNVHPYIDGMISYENEVIKIVNLRKILGMPTFETELKNLFLRLQEAHKNWIDELEHSVNEKNEFTKTTDPHKCELGMWLDEFNSYDEHVSEILKDLILKHKLLHRTGGNILEIMNNNHEEAKKMLQQKIFDIYEQTMGSLETFVQEYEKISNSIQKLIVYENGSVVFAFKVDAILGIEHIEDSLIMQSESEYMSEFLELKGFIQENEETRKIIKSFKLPK